MKKSFAVSAILQLFVFVSFAQVKLQNLLTENLVNPTGIDVQQPRFSWQLVTDKKSVVQTAYEIIVSAPGKSGFWKSGKVISDSSVHVAYKGAPFQSGVRYTWEVRVWDNTGKPSAWSEPAFFRTALLNTSDWKAKWIEPGYMEDSIMRPSPYFRKEFTAKKKLQSAIA